VAFARIEKEPSGGGYQVTTQEGSPFSISTELFLSQHLALGQELNEEEFFHLKSVYEHHRCRAQAMTYLARREHTGFELRIKLQQKGFDQDCITDTLDILEGENLFSELRYAQQFIESRQRKNPEGRILMAQRLAAKGVKRETATMALDQLYSEELTIEYVVKAYVMALRKTGEDKARQALMKKGFSSYDIRLGLESLS